MEMSRSQQSLVPIASWSRHSGPDASLLRVSARVRWLLYAGDSCMGFVCKTCVITWHLQDGFQLVLSVASLRAEQLHFDSGWWSLSGIPHSRPRHYCARRPVDRGCGNSQHHWLLEAVQNARRSGGGARVRPAAHLVQGIRPYWRRRSEL